VPERAVIDSGTKKVVYVERQPGLFEGVEVELGPRVELVEGGRTVDYYPVVRGLAKGDKVAAAGAFLIDAETRLNPAAASTYFGASGSAQSGAPQSNAAYGVNQPAGKPARYAAPAGEALAQIGQLPEADRKLALAQRVCPITGLVLGSMGVPVKIVLKGQPVFLCCPGCEAAARENPEKTLKRVAELMAGAR
jgi:membrane fusion protein, copper/silver efflux system